ncbi:MAG: hypothetical protein H6706_31065 [Myxococcales bacterium]|nr:hypothetical protein [Myxococcales bacterium]
MARRRTDYASPAFRHLRDGEYLLQGATSDARRRMNADQLFGLAWECALKAIMVGLGMPMDRPRPVYGRVLGPMPRRKADFVHANKVLPRFTHYANGRAQAHYAAQLGAANPFADWKVDQRYLNDGRYPGRRVVEGHQRAARIGMGVLQQAIMDGVVRP